MGAAGAQQFILEKVPQWLQKYGPNGEKVAFFCTNDAQTEPLIKQVAASKNGIFVEPDSASPLMGFPGALGLDLSAEKGNFPAIMKKIEADAGGQGRRRPAGHLGLQHRLHPGRRPGRTGQAGGGRQGQADQPQGHLRRPRRSTPPGAKWNGAYYTDMSTGVRAKNELLVYMDTYVFGKGYIGTTAQKVPEKYFTVKK